MMHGWLTHYGGEYVEVKSAGVETHGVNPTAIKVMAESDVDISGHTSNHIDEYLNEQFDVVITVCDHARERCPVFPEASQLVHHNFSDPAQATGTDEEKLAAFRKVRDEIKDFSRKLLSDKLS